VTGRLDGGVAVVTGAGAGLGRAEALALARAGAAVVVNDVAPAERGPSPADAVVAEIVAAGGRAVACRGDVADWEVAEHLVRTAVETYGDLTVLVNNAGVLRDRMVFGMSEAEWDTVVRVHLKGHFCTSRFATAHWRARAKATGHPVWGRVINTASEAFLAGSPGQPNYAAAKAGIVALTLATAKGCATYGVTANAICPRAATAMTAPNFASSAGDHRDRFAPEHVARLVAALAERAAGAITGQVFVAYADTVHLLAAPTVAATFRARDGRWGEDELAGLLEQYFTVPGASPGFAADEVLGLATGWRPGNRPA
jgi:NAD(P)-dependent dehydrogenase (short-subunit alcohol dehydrogenase family)